MDLPETLTLIDLYPNPFNPSITIRYQLLTGSEVHLRLFDSAGRLAASLVDGWREAGKHEVIFDGTKFASGVYLYQFRAGDYQNNGKMLLLK